jgi:hypothetical protein
MNNGAWKKSAVAVVTTLGVKALWQWWRTRRQRRRARRAAKAIASNSHD